jgi:hypothetical protein
MTTIQSLSIFQPLQLAFILLLSTSASCLAERIIDLNPGESFEKAVESLQAGDTLIVHSGTYSGTGRISIAVRGTIDQPVVIKRADGESRPLITRPDNKVVQNTINIEGSSYLTIQGLEITGNGGDAIRVNEQPSDHIILQNLLIHHIDVGINTKNNSHDFIIRNNHIHHTGIDQGTGEGMYIGCHDGSCSLSDSIIEHNLIHDVLPGTTQGDGIEIKVNSQNIVIRNNVIYNRPFPGIFVYGGGVSNIVEGNVVWNSLEGIAAVSDAVVRNNILFDNETGLISFHHAAVAVVENTSFVNNTLYNNDIGALLRWNDASNMVFANNAVYSPGKLAIDASTASQIVSSNVTQGDISDFSDNPDPNRFRPGRSAGLDFNNPANNDFWPTADSPLIASANATYIPNQDFNEQVRQFPADIGAYQRADQITNPGWALAATFKGIVARVKPPVAVSPVSGTNAFLFATEAIIDHHWSSLSIPVENNTSQLIPVVIAGVPTQNGPQPGIVQIANISASQVDLRFKEYNYLDGFHSLEKLDILVAEPGVHHLADGTIVDVGSFDLSSVQQWQTVDLVADFPEQPLVFLTIQTANNDRAVMVRARNITSNSFEAALYQQESQKNQLISEQVGFIAIYHPEANGVFTIGSGDARVSNSYSLSQIDINHQPTAIADHTIKLEEEQSKDLELKHVNEAVNIMQIGDAVFGQIASDRGSDTVSLRLR